MQDYFDMYPFFFGANKSVIKHAKMSLLCNRKNYLSKSSFSDSFAFTVEAIIQSFKLKRIVV